MSHKPRKTIATPKEIRVNALIRDALPVDRNEIFSAESLAAKLKRHGLTRLLIQQRLWHMHQGSRITLKAQATRGRYASAAIYTKNPYSGCDK